MTYICPQYSKKAVSRAGDVLVLGKSGTEEYDEALKVINNWRASHTYPLQKIKDTLARRAKKIDASSITAQRLKRLTSIESKLRLLNKTRLGGIQDIGGCRAILKNVSQVNALIEVYLDAQSKNPIGRPQLIDTDDYIEPPKITGYRSVHLVLQYQSDTEARQVYNGLKIEIQIRTRLQHFWATAVETAGTFLGQQLKSGVGDERWKRFFALASSVFALIEKCELVPNTPTTKRKLVSELQELWEELNVYTFLSGCAVTTTMTAKNFPNFGRVLLKLNSKQREIDIKVYAKNDLIAATEDYLTAERETADKPEMQVVLVSVDNLAKLRVAYPNYYADTSEFLKVVENAINEKK